MFLTAYCRSVLLPSDTAEGRRSERDRETGQSQCAEGGDSFGLLQHSFVSHAPLPNTDPGPDTCRRRGEMGGLSLALQTVRELGAVVSSPLHDGNKRRLLQSSKLLSFFLSVLLQVINRALLLAMPKLLTNYLYIT
jgi:hypothetical protein